MKRTHEIVERELVRGLLSGDPKPGSHLQSERDLAARFAVSRATVREALLRMQNAGWIIVRERHATIVNDFWAKGDLELLSSITKNSDSFPLDLASHLLELRIQFAPDYARKAVENDALQLTACLSRFSKIRNSSSALERFDWEVHLTMAVLSGNKIYPLIMNSFTDFYAKLRGEFFVNEEHRSQARSFYGDLLQAAGTGNADQAEDVTRAAMKLRLENFKRQASVAAALGL